MNIIVFGPPGSGKGTQAHLLIKRFGLRIIEMGAIMRQIAQGEDELAQRLRENMNLGKLNDDVTVIQVLNQYLLSFDSNQGLLFDGFPRTTNQWNSLKLYLQEQNTKIDAVVYFELSEQECTYRITHRVMSKSSGQIFNFKTLPPPSDWPKSDLLSREDNSPETIKTRFEEYRRSTEPLLEIFRSEGLLITVSANQSIENIHDQVVNQLQDKGVVSV